jgi:hypothetical protein
MKIASGQSFARFRAWRLSWSLFARFPAAAYCGQNGANWGVGEPVTARSHFAGSRSHFAGSPGHGALA